MVCILGWFAIPSSRDHILSEISVMTHPSWVVVYDMAHNFTELHKTHRHDKAVIQEGTLA